MPKFELPLSVRLQQKEEWKPLATIHVRGQVFEKTLKQLALALWQSKNEEEFMAQAKTAWNQFAPLSEAAKGAGRPSDKQKLYAVIRKWYRTNNRAITVKVSGYQLEQYVKEHYKHRRRKPSDAVIRKYVRLWRLELTPVEQLKQPDLKWVSQTAPALFAGIRVVREANQMMKPH